MVNAIASQIPGFMSLALMGKSAGMAKDSFSKKKKKPTFMKDSITIMAGIPLVSGTAGMVNVL